MSPVASLRVAMAELIRKNGLDTVSFEHCENACTFLLAAGTERYLGPKSKVGFHRSWTYKTLFRTSWSRVDYRMADYYWGRRVSSDFVKQVLDTPGYKMWYPEHGLMFAAGYTTKNWY